MSVYLMFGSDQVIAGPFPDYRQAVALYEHLPAKGVGYYNASRYELSKKLFPRTKAGDQALALAVWHPELAPVLVALLGRVTFAHDFPEAHLGEILTLLRRYHFPTSPNSISRHA